MTRIVGCSIEDSKLSLMTGKTMRDKNISFSWIRRLDEQGLVFRAFQAESVASDVRSGRKDPDKRSANLNVHLVTHLV